MEVNWASSTDVIELAWDSNSVSCFLIWTINLCFSLSVGQSCHVSFLPGLKAGIVSQNRNARRTPHTAAPGIPRKSVSESAVHGRSPLWQDRDKNSCRNKCRTDKETECKEIQLHIVTWISRWKHGSVRLKSATTDRDGSLRPLGYAFLNQERESCSIYRLFLISLFFCLKISGYF